jgi:hypothetical protein
MSQTSIPISALVSPHAPSVLHPGAYHMKDPRKPKIQATRWALAFKDMDNEEEGSPVQAWLFFSGFILFPLWWVSSLWRIPKTRTVGGTDTEKAVVVDDPQVEHGTSMTLYFFFGKMLIRSTIADAKSWRFRCRIMSLISFFTYIPFIILLAIFLKR